MIGTLRSEDRYKRHFTSAHSYEKSTRYRSCSNVGYNNTYIYVPNTVKNIYDNDIKRITRFNKLFKFFNFTFNTLSTLFWKV